MYSLFYKDNPKQTLRHSNGTFLAKNKHPTTHVLCMTVWMWLSTTLQCRLFKSETGVYTSGKYIVFWSHNFLSIPFHANRSFRRFWWPCHYSVFGNEITVSAQNTRICGTIGQFWQTQASSIRSSRRYFIRVVESLLDCESEKSQESFRRRQTTQFTKVWQLAPQQIDSSTVNIVQSTDSISKQTPYYFEKRSHLALRPTKDKEVSSKLCTSGRSLHTVLEKYSSVWRKQIQLPLCE